VVKIVWTRTTKQVAETRLVSLQASANAHNTNFFYPTIFLIFIYLFIIIIFFFLHFQVATVKEYEKEKKGRNFFFGFFELHVETETPDENWWKMLA
jgi:hypothetical protein